MSRQQQPGDVPSWFTAAIAQEPERRDIEVDGCRIHVRAWGEKGQPPLVLVHGGGAHSGWWDHIAPFFARTHRVIAPDLSGHGDSGTRAAYRLRTWAREAVAVSAVDGPSDHHPTLVGHSMGGWIATVAARRDGASIDSIVVIDSPLWDHAPEAPQLRNRKRRNVGYRSKNEILKRFVPVPAQESVLPFVAEHIATESVRRTLAGWTWKFDPAIFDTSVEGQREADQDLMEATLTRMPCRIAYLRCEAGLVPVNMADKIRSLLQLRGPFVELAEAGHHPMLDQPLPLVATLRSLLELWSIT